MDSSALRRFVDSTWDDSILPALVEYIRIPNKSPHFDREWAAHGHMERAVELVSGWCERQELEGCELEVIRLPGRTPLIAIEVAGDPRHTVLLYGHLDKQPEMTGWAAGLGPWEPVMRDGRLYGRGGADDGYAAFASMTALRGLARAKVKHARCVILIEACEESGSYDLPFYIEHLRERLGSPELVVCLDSGCGNYEQLWSTTSLRGIVTGNLTVEILTEGVHSGDASGIVPSSFRIARELLSRIEDERSGRVLPREFQAEIPTQRSEQADRAAAALTNTVWSKFPFVGGARPMGGSPAELVLSRTWRPALSITGADGFPKIADAGNVLRPASALKLSLRLPPTCDARQGAQVLKRLLEDSPPYGARVSFEADEPGQGWNAPPVAPWLERATDDASRAHFGKPAMYMGEGGSIPFMGMLGASFPAAQFLITGVLGPGSNAHGPNEYLHVETGKRLTACVAEVVAAHARDAGI